MSTDFQSILTFWFGESASDSEIIEQKSSLWWKKDQNTDQTIRDKFGHLIHSLQEGKLESWTQTDEGYLALIILTDQFSRNMFRDTAQSFEFDPVALKLCLDGIDQGIDRKLGLIQRIFYYLPLEHAESMEMQDKSVALIGEVCDSAAEDLKPAFQGFLNYAIEHRKVIETFGRYPHRNKILGRVSTKEELAYLEQPGAGF